MDTFSSVIQYGKESLTVDIGIGAGMGVDVAVNEVQAAAIVREDFFTLKKDSGSLDFEIGKKSEMYSGVSAYSAFI